MKALKLLLIAGVVLIATVVLAAAVTYLTQCGGAHNLVC